MSNQLSLRLSSGETIPLYYSCIKRIFLGLEKNGNEVTIQDREYFGAIRDLLLSDDHLSASADYDYNHIQTALSSCGKETTLDVCCALTEITNNLLGSIDSYSDGEDNAQQHLQFFLGEFEKIEQHVLQLGEYVLSDEWGNNVKLYDSYYALLTLLVGIGVVSLSASNKPLKAETKSIIKSFGKVLDGEVRYALQSFSNLVPTGEMPIINHRLDRLPFINDDNDIEIFKEFDRLDLQKTSLRVLCYGLLLFLTKKNTPSIILDVGHDYAVISIQEAGLTLFITINTVFYSPKGTLSFFLTKYHGINEKIQVLVFDPENWNDESDIMTCFQKKKAHGFYSGEYFVSSYYSFVKRLELPYTEFFVKRTADCIRNHTISTSNIGALLSQHKEELIRDLAVSSNHFIGTFYDVKDEISQSPLLSALFSSSFHSEKDTVKQTIYRDLSMPATNNLRILYSDDLCIQFFTSEWLYKNMGSMGGLDNTFICAGYFKLVEKLLSHILIQDYSGDAYGFFRTNYGATLHITEENERFFMLGNMVSYFKTTKEAPLSEYKYSAEIVAAFDQWTQRIRNGYFHKDFLPAEEVNEIRNRTLEIIYFILGLFPKRDT